MDSTKPVNYDTASSNAVAELQKYIDALKKRYDSLLVLAKYQLGHVSDLTKMIEATSITVNEEIMTINGLIYDMQFAVTEDFKKRNIVGILRELERRVHEEVIKKQSEAKDKSTVTPIKPTTVETTSQLTPIKPIEEQSDEELEERKKMLIGKCKKFADIVDRQPEHRKALLKASLHSMSQWISNESDMIDKLMKNRRDTAYYFTTGDGRDGGAGAMLDSWMKSLDYTD